MTGFRSTGSVRRRARAADQPAPLPARRRREQSRPFTRAERLEPRVLLSTYTVTTTADEGPGSLRQAILDANANAGADEVNFAIPGDAGVVCTIRPLSSLPAATGPTTIDATTQSGYAGSPLIELDGSAAGPDADGLVLVSMGGTVRAVTVNRFSRHGIVFMPSTGPLADTSYGRVEGCQIGTDPSGELPRGNGGAGILALGTGLSVGRTRAGQLSVVSANGGPGVWVKPGSPTRSGLIVNGVRIGTNAPGTAALGNGGDGVLVQHDTRVMVGAWNGPDPAPQGNNIISGNAGSGIRIGTAVVQGHVAFVNNFIGTDVTATRALPNGGDGVTLEGGSIAEVTSNVISGNVGAGVAVRNYDTNYYAAHSNVIAIAGNLIGTDRAGDAPLGNGGDGILATRFIGRYTSLGLVSNRIAANRGNGVSVFGDPSQSWTVISNVILRDNEIGISAAGAALGNAGNGVELRDIWQASLGEPRTDGPYRNVIAANGGHGILIKRTPISQSTARISVWSNFIGTNRSGMTPLGNRGSGIYLEGVNGVTVGPPLSARPEEFVGIPSNVIAANGGDGVTIVGRSYEGGMGPRHVLAGNRIGVGYDRESPNRIIPLPNAGYGVAITNSSGNHIKRTADGMPPNVIAHNTRGGVLVHSADGLAALYNSIQGNSIFANGGPAIDLWPVEGANANDQFDYDSGPNELLNHPVITSTEITGGLMRVHYSYTGMPSMVVQFEFFTTSTAHPTGHGEGERFLKTVLGRVPSNGTLTGYFVIPRAAATGWLTATATDPRGNTSEFSPAVSTRIARAAYRPPPAQVPPITATRTLYQPVPREVLAPRDLLS